MNENACERCYACLNRPDLGIYNPVNRLMILCPTCGNKRCPKATHHGNECAGSNLPGQTGSMYPAWPTRSETKESK